jgi:proteasome assembly chaperone (PAC2) family protein
MLPNALKIHAHPKLSNARLVLGFSGWMDGGNVSTGTIATLISKLQAEKLAEIDSQSFYIYNFPGSMEITALFRPHVKIEEGLIKAFDPPTNTFYYDRANNLILFEGKEPNLSWGQYCDCIFSLAAEFNVNILYFVGSVAGLVPHTRAPRILGSVSDEELKLSLQPYRLRFTNYEGPGSIVTCLTKAAPERGLQMISLVAEIPAYIQSRNIMCIEAVTRQLAAMLGLKIDIDYLHVLSEEIEKKITDIVEKQPELAERIQKLESDYDNEVFESQMGDLKDWLERQGIRLD